MWFKLYCEQFYTCVVSFEMSQCDWYKGSHCEFMLTFEKSSEYLGRCWKGCRDL